MRLKILGIGACILAFLSLNAQDNFSYSTRDQIVAKRISRAPAEVSFDWKLSIQNLEAPFQHNETYAYHLQQLKAEIAARYPRRESAFEAATTYTTNLIPPFQTDSFEANQYSGSVPNDNTMAISNSGFVISAINTNIFFYDTQTDSLMKSISLEAFSDTLKTVSSHQYDPKIVYDYQTDRFILVYLAGASSDNTTHIIVAFSSSSNPLNEWNFYALPGNPLNDTSWTDFPAIALSNDELFITGNLLFYGTSWQTSFKQSVIWQVDKYKGYAGDSLNTKLYYNISFDNRKIRNLHPVWGGKEFYGPEMYFLSNRNFSVQCDSFFLLKTSGKISSNPSLNIRFIRSNHHYGAPPKARQPGNKWLETNDARVLGAFYHNNYIQFVGNTIDTVGGKARIYHGIIQYPDVATTLRLNLISDPVLEYGYPNISWFGTHNSDQRSVINCNYSASTVNPGFGAFVYDLGGSPFNPNDQYSPLNKLKEGESYISILLGGNQRWGDYSGSQRRYNQDGKVWVCGTYGKLVGSSRRYATWVAELSSLPLAVDENERTIHSVKLFPNPVNEGRVSLEFELLKSCTAEVDIYDLTGNLIYKMYSGKLKQGRNLLEFSTDNLSAGVYVIKITSEQSVLSTKKITVIR